ncbi:MAG: S46 family peptidase [Verrucomicrobiae bacterium]|nr:S46 family peptidase [Verrucomicrobiae bacterium]
MEIKKTAVVMTAAMTLIAMPAGISDEGMWLFNKPPREILKERYGFIPSDEWLIHLQRASVRFNSGGSGSFVSEDGLVMSNHHVGADALQKMSNEKRNYLKDGFYARTLEEEIPCHDLELNVLMSIEDVTERVNAAVPKDAPPEEAFSARRKVIAEIEKESLQKTGLRSDVVTLYQGGAYHLYRFKRYTDVRLVFAPEQQIAFFGGDPDNFEYPRYCLDVCFFRVYEDGKPAKIEHYLKWNESGVSENELVFVSGHPGRTSRLLTVAELEYLRDDSLPYLLERLYRLEVLLNAWGQRSPENARKAMDDLFGVQNSRKARVGRLAGLLDSDFMAKKREQEARLRDEVAKRDNLKDCVDAWDKIAQAQSVIQKNALRYRMLEQGHGFNSELFQIARTLLRAATELPKPNGDRLKEFRDSARPSLELELFSTKPIYEDYEEVRLADSLTYLVSKLGYSDPIVQKVLNGKSPSQRAAELVHNTKVKDVDLRKKIYHGGMDELQKLNDPMIELAKLIDQPAREVRQIIDTQDEIRQQAHAKISRARFAIEGDKSYPDATFTLRLAFGTVRGYEENGKHIPYQTTYSGLYERAALMGYKHPFDLPDRWLKAKSKLNLDTPLNFVSTADIIGGNSGSPVVNRKGEFVGIIFDGNIQSLVLDFYFTDIQARALAVHSKGIIEALKKVYKADALANELLGKYKTKH